MDPILRRKTLFAGRLVCDIVILSEQLLVYSLRHGSWIAVLEEKDNWRALLNVVVRLIFP